MEDNKNNIENAFVDDKNNYNKKIVPAPIKEKNIGIDTNNTIIKDISDISNASASSTLDLAKINSFHQTALSRNQIYEYIDTMGEDAIIAAVLETYAEDVTQYNDNGDIVWAESSDANIAKHIKYLLSEIQINKHIYQWAFNVVKYGDVYVRLFRNSEYEFPNEDKKKDKKKLNEDLIIKAYRKNDHYSHYVEMVPNPAQMFELTRLGKSYAYIDAPVPVLQRNDNPYHEFEFNYKFDYSDVTLYPPTEFVHASLEDTSNRSPEKVDLFINKDGEEKQYLDTSFSVKRGQSILYNMYKIWRQKQLLEDAILLNRVTKSSLVRILNIEIGDMDKNKVPQHVAKVKQMVEQKTALNTGTSMSEYTNPGPIENTIYIPTRNGIGKIESQEIGTNITDVKNLADLDYFNNLLFGGLKVPKQYFACLRGTTPILLLNGETVTIEEMFNHKEEYIGKGIMACDIDGKLVPTLISNIMLTNPSTSFLRIHLDNGKHVDVTQDHRLMLRDGRFILAEDLNVGDSLMPYYDYIKEGRRYVLDNYKGKYYPQYRVVAESVCDIPKGYQIHHKNSIKIDDDFDNLIPLTVSEHYNQHKDMLHESNKRYCQERRENGEPVSKHCGQRMINNGIRQYWINSDEELPVGYVYGMLPFTEEHKQNISKNTKGKAKNRIAPYSKQSEEAKLKMSNTIKNRQAESLYNDNYKKQSERMKRAAKEKTGWHSKEAYDKKYSRYPANRRNTLHYVRCLKCGSVHEILCNEDWYSDYLNQNLYWFCSKNCAKINGGGKLARSYKLFTNSNSNYEEYEINRWNNESKPDTFFKASTLKDYIKYIENYAPNCNHKVVNIEYIDVDEPAYDIKVAADCHTFALPCGIFVHNCTDDNTGFNGGTSLTIISSRYARTVKRIQNTLVQAITDIINLFLMDSGLDYYINKFTIKMCPPLTQEEKDNKENQSNALQLTKDIVDLIGDKVDDEVANLKILKSLLSINVNNQEVLELLQDEIDKKELENENSEDNKESELDDTASDEDVENMRMDNFNEPSESSQSSPSQTDTETSEVEETESEEDINLPSPNELDTDMTQNI